MLIAHRTITMYSLADDNRGAPGVDWLHDPIYFIKYERTASFGWNAVQNWVRQTDGAPEAGTFVYRHHVPYQRIFLAIRNFILSKNLTRNNIVQWLNVALGELGIPPDPTLHADPRASRLQFDVWAQWAIEAVLDWRYNVFYGPGTNDHAGTQLDWPHGGVNETMQTKRLMEAGQLLKSVVGVSLDQIVPLGD
ncbi:hypothetical protein H0H81_001711 [Sphagnurus paluster]|uniref:Uncharacterized protein n=1 Tax=Sphagnurus paluster TaxID=117069 RepID=A0A9P7GH27_9AGAR|nr:hypothetical protein H0H81_001711 [Sphagnurus paluster]